MISGRDALRQIDHAISAARKTVEDAGNEANDQSRRLIEIRQGEANAYQQIATIRLESLGAKEEGVNALSDVDRKASQYLDDHEKFIEELEQKRDAASDHLSAFEDKRRNLEDTLNKLIDKHEQAAEKTRKKLENDPEYQKRADALEKANAVVDHAASKKELALQDRHTKGEPYENDTLFKYLWDRKFATSDYKGGIFSGPLDRWVSKLIKFRDARLNYIKLLEIPERLLEHVDFVEQKASLIADDIEAYERKALEKDGVDALRDKVSDARKEIEISDTHIEQAESEHQNILDEVNKATDGNHGPLHEARTLLSNILKDKSVPDLKILAAETLTHEDDRLVETLADMRLERFSIEDALKTTKRSSKDYQRNLSELEKLRRRFKKSRFDSHQSEFKNSEIINLLLKDFTRGALGAVEIWRRIQREHRVHRRDWHDDFGGDDWRGGFGLPGGSGRGNEWAQVGRDITRQIERELGRELGNIIYPGGLGRSRRPTRRRRPRTVSIPRRTRRTPRTRPSRRSSTRRGGGGFRTGGGF